MLANQWLLVFVIFVVHLCVGVHSVPLRNSTTVFSGVRVRRWVEGGRPTVGGTTALIAPCDTGAAWTVVFTFSERPVRFTSGNGGNIRTCIGAFSCEVTNKFGIGVRAGQQLRLDFIASFPRFADARVSARWGLVCGTRAGDGCIAAGGHCGLRCKEALEDPEGLLCPGDQVCCVRGSSDCKDAYGGTCVDVIENDCEDFIPDDPQFRLCPFEQICCGDEVSTTVKPTVRPTKPILSTKMTKPNLSTKPTAKPTKPILSTKITKPNISTKPSHTPSKPVTRVTKPNLSTKPTTKPTKPILSTKVTKPIVSTSSTSKPISTTRVSKPNLSTQPATTTIARTKVTRPNLTSDPTRPKLSTKGTNPTKLTTPRVVTTEKGTKSTTTPSTPVTVTPSVQTTKPPTQTSTKSPSTTSAVKTTEPQTNTTDSTIHISKYTTTKPQTTTQTITNTPNSTPINIASTLKPVSGAKCIAKNGHCGMFCQKSLVDPKGDLCPSGQSCCVDGSSDCKDFYGGRCYNRKYEICDALVIPNPPKFNLCPGDEGCCGDTVTLPPRTTKRVNTPSP